MVYAGLFLRILLSVVCLAAAAGKLGGQRRRREFRRFVARLGLPDRLVTPAAAGIVGAELAVGALTPWPVTAVPGAALAAGLFATLAIGVQLAVRRGRTPRCFCFGRLGQPLGRAHVIRNVVLAGAAGTGLGLSWLTAGSGPGLAGGAVAAAGAVLAAGPLVFWDDLAALFAPGMTPVRPTAAQPAVGPMADAAR
jgi:hypothetical protein